MKKMDRDPGAILIMFNGTLMRVAKMISNKVERKRVGLTIVRLVGLMIIDYLTSEML